MTSLKPSPSINTQCASLNSPLLNHQRPSKTVSTHLNSKRIERLKVIKSGYRKEKITKVETLVLLVSDSLRSLGIVELCGDQTLL